MVEDFLPATPPPLSDTSLHTVHLQALPDCLTPVSHDVAMSLTRSLCARAQIEADQKAAEDRKSAIEAEKVAKAAAEVAHVEEVGGRTAE